MQRLSHRLCELENGRSSCLDDRLAGQHRIPPEGDLERTDVQEIFESQLLGLAHERLRHDGKLDYPLGKSGESLGIAAGSDDLGLLVGIHAQPSQRETEAEVGRASQAVDAAGLSLELLYLGDRWQ